MEKLINFEHHPSYLLLFVFRPWLSNQHNGASGNAFGCDSNHSILFLFLLQLLPYDKAYSAPLYFVYCKGSEGSQNLYYLNLLLSTSVCSVDFILTSISP